MYTLKIFLISSLFFLSGMHPVHVSVTNFELLSKENKATMSVKVFADDFDLAILHNYNLRLNLGTDSIHPEWERYISQYFNKMFLVKANNKTAVPLVLQHYEMADDGIYVHFFLPVKGKIRSLQIHNGILLDVFENQTNLLITTIDGKESGYSLNFNNYKLNIKL